MTDDAHDLLATDVPLPPLRPDFLSVVREQGRRSVRRRRLGAGLAGVLLVVGAVPVVSGLTKGGDTTVLAVVTETPQADQRPASAAPALPAGGELVTSQPTVPNEAAFVHGHADIATTAQDAARAWARFRLDGAPPSVEPGTALLFRGLGESGSCPIQFSGLEVQGDQVRLTTRTRDSDQERLCTFDSHPRTLVVMVPVDALPVGAFFLDGFLLSATTLPSPPTGPSIVDSRIAEDPQVQVRAQPDTVAAGGRVEVLLTTGQFSAAPASFATLLERWAGQRWLPAAGADPYKGHPAVTRADRQLPADSTGTMAVIDTAGLDSGQYRLVARLGLGDSEGSTGVQAFFVVTG